MKRLLFLALIATASSSLLAEPAQQAEQAQVPQTQVPQTHYDAAEDYDNPGFGGYDDYINNDDLLVLAYDVRRGLLHQPEVNAEIIKEIETMIRDLLSQEDQRVLKSYRFILRRYDHLSRICERKNFNVEAYTAVANLIAKRNKLARESITIITRIQVAQNIIQNLGSLFAEKLSPEQAQRYKDDFSKMCDDSMARMEKIQHEMALLEHKLLADPRTFFEKYGTLLTGTALTAGGLFVVGSLVNMGAEVMSSKKTDAPTTGTTGGAA